MVLELGSREINTTGLQISQQNIDLLFKQSVFRLHMIILLYGPLPEIQFKEYSDLLQIINLQ